MGDKNPGPPDALFPVIYGELRHVAAAISAASGGITRCSRRRSCTKRGCGCRTRRGSEWEGRTHGLALGAQAMRRLLIDHGRHQKREKRGGGVQPVSRWTIC